MIHTAKFIRSKTVCFEVRNKATNQIDKLSYVTVFFGGYELFHYLFVGTGMQLKTVIFQFLLQML